MPNQERNLRSLLARIEATREPTSDLVAELLLYACPRLQAVHGPNLVVQHLVEAKAWVDLGLWLVGWELPDWVVHRLSCDERQWNCAICVRGLAINWVEDIADSVFEKVSWGHGQRRTSVAEAAMVMRVSATAVSCS